MAYFFKLLAVILVGGAGPKSDRRTHPLWSREKKLANNSNFPEASGTIKERHLIN